MPRKDDLQDLIGLSQLRAQYLKIGLAIAAAIYLLRAAEPGTVGGPRTIRIAMALACAGGWAWVSRSRVGSPRAVQAAYVLVLLITVGIALGHPPGVFPFGLLLLPGLAAVGTLLGGAGLGLIVVATAAGAGLSLFAIGPVEARPTLLGLQVTNLSIVLVVVYVYALRLSSLLNDGLSNLARSAETLHAMRESTTSLTRDLTSRFAGALAALRGALDAKADVRPACLAAGALLAESRHTIPPEPVVPEPNLETKLLSLRRSLATWTFRIVLLGLGVNLLAHLVAPPSHRPPHVVPLLVGLLALVAGLTALDVLRPRWFKPLTIVFHVCFTSVLTYVSVAWLHVHAGLPPGTVAGGVIPILATGVVGPALGFCELLVGAVALLVAAPSDAVPWILPVTQALAYGLVCWATWHIPRQLIGYLSVRRAEALREIRRRRRLVATLFHDMAGPLLVVQSVLDLSSAGAGEPSDDETVRGMVDRMRKILDAAMAETSEVRPVAVGRLFDALEALFRDRVRAKGLALRVHRGEDWQVLCRETLLTESVLANLVSNAIKFTPAGTTIDVLAEEDRGSVVLLVEDRGPGLPAAVRDSLSKGIMSTSLPGTLGEMGSGYGLMLAQDYVCEMGGSLELADRQGGGLSARIRLKSIAGPAVGTSLRERALE